MCRLPGLYTLPRGPAEPLDITDMCNLSHDNLNNINTSTPQEKLKLFVQLVKKRTSEDLIEELKTKAPLIPRTQSWYFTSVLEKNVDTDKIILLADGSWKPLDPADKREYQLVNSICDNSTAEDSEPAHYDKTAYRYLCISSDKLQTFSANVFYLEYFQCTDCILLVVIVFQCFYLSVHGRGTATTPECSSVETITLSDDESLSSSSQATYQSDGVSSKAQTPLVGTVRSTSGIFQSPNFHETPESFSSTSQALNSSTPNIFSFSIAQLFTSSTPQRSGCRKMRPLLASVPKRKSKRIRQDMTNANRNNSLSNLSISSGNISRHSCTVSGENSVSSTLDNSESSGLNVITNSSETGP
nr:uncharacterized protein LOC128705274 [Cherax quadricarinatus]